jgi:glycyl-tRNA synthetase beta chain
VSIAVALADKLDQLLGFFATGEKPTGSGDPYALRRAALGIVRIIRENALRVPLSQVLGEAAKFLGGQQDPVVIDAHVSAEVLEFIVDRLYVQLRAEGARHDILTAVFEADKDDDITRLLARTAAVTALLNSGDGANLLTAYRRAANILRIESRKDGPHDAAPDRDLLRQEQEADLAHALGHADAEVVPALAREDYTGAMTAMAALRAPMDAFFDQVTVNAPEPQLRLNRLRLLNRVQAIMDRVADFSKIEG